MSRTSPDPRSPVIIGAGQFLNRDEPGRAPLDLMVEALQAAERDAGAAGALAKVDTIAVVPTFSWRYSDPGRLVGRRIGASDATTWYANVGGNTPQMFVNRLARHIAEGSVDLAVLTGGEAGRSRRLAKAEGGDATWDRQPTDEVPDWLDDSPFLMAHPAEVARSIVMPTQCYPLFETALWHDSGRTFEEHLAFIGGLWSGFAEVAADNPYAWRREALSAQEITTPTPENRLVGFPYTKRMVSNPDVDMATGLIMCSLERARELGIDEDRLVFVHAGTDGVDRKLSERTDFISSPAIRTAGNRALELAGVGIDEVAHLDVYSCFPSAVQIALRELSIPADRQLTVYGGLPFAGGPWNNPVGHAIASMVQVLRGDPGSTGLVTANGGNVDKHAFGVYSTTPPADGFHWDRPQDRIDAAAAPVDVEADHQGPATIEAWTVMHGRDGAAERAHAACRTPSGARTWGVTDDAEVMELFEQRDVAGTAVVLGADGRLDLG